MFRISCNRRPRCLHLSSSRWSLVVAFAFVAVSALSQQPVQAQQNVGNDIPTAAPMIIEYWSDSQGHDGGDSSPTPAPILWEYWPTTSDGSYNGEVPPTDEVDDPSNNNTQREVDGEVKKSATATESDSHDHFTSYAIPIVACILVAGMALFWTRYFRNSNSGNNCCSKPLFLKKKKPDESTDRSMDESDGGDTHLVVATDNHLVGLDLEQPKQHPEPLHPPLHQDDGEDAIIQANYPDLENGTTSGDATQGCLPAVQLQLHQPQHTRPTLQCRKLLAVESLRTRQGQQQHQSQLLDNQGDHDSFVVRVLKQANAPPASEQTEL